MGSRSPSGSVTPDRRPNTVSRGGGPAGQSGRMDTPRRGPLSGLRVLEFAGLGPTSFCGMLLSDMGADVLRIERPRAAPSPHPILERGRRQVVLDLKSPAG